MIVYLFDATSKEYCGTYDCPESPREPGQYLIPQYCTTVKPSSLKDKQAAIFNESTNKWKIVNDYRGTTMYDETGMPHYINNLDDVKDTYTTEYGTMFNDVYYTPKKWEAYIKTKEYKKALFDLKLKEKKEELKTKFSTASSDAHCTSSLGFEINADETANRDIRGLIDTTEDGEVTLFRDYDNQFHEVSLDNLKVMLKEVIQNAKMLYQKKWSFEQQITSCTTIEELENIIIDFDA